MKNTILFASIFMLGFSMIVKAQEPISVRSQSLGNVIEDDWDLIYDPIELRFVDGMYFFTNLADFNYDIDTTGETTQIRNKFLEEFPIGISFKNPLLGFVKHSFLLRLKNSRRAENANGGDGEYEYNTSNYFDSDGNGLYDTKTLTSGKYSNYDIDRRSAFVLNNNLKLGPMTFGWKLSYDHKASETDEAKTGMGVYDFGGYLHGVNLYSYGPSLNYGFDESTNHYLLEENYSDHMHSEQGNFLTKEEDTVTKSHMAFMMKIGLEFRADLINQILTDGKVETNDHYSGEYTTYDDADMLGFETGIITETYNELINGNGSVHKLGGSVKSVFDPRDERKNDGFWQAGAMLGTSLGDYESSSGNHFEGTINRVYSDSTNSDWSETYTKQEIISDAGDYKGSSLDIFGRLQIPIGETINFGIGGYFNYHKTTRSTDYNSETNEITEILYNYEHYDYKLTNHSKLIADRTYESIYSGYKIPVGLEFRMPKDDLSQHDSFSLRNFSFRIGTTFFSTRTIINDKHQITESLPYTTTYESGDGNVTIDIDNNHFTSTSIRTENIKGKKRFSAGIGYRHSENLQIDLGGYGDEEDFFVGISFTVKLSSIEKPINP